jgi:hypothetical protein
MSFTGKPKISLKNPEIQINRNKCPKTTVEARLGDMG